MYVMPTWFRFAFPAIFPFNIHMVNLLLCVAIAHAIFCCTVYFCGLASFGHLYVACALLCISVLDAFVIPRLARLVFAVSLFAACLIVWVQGAFAPPPGLGVTHISQTSRCTCDRLFHSSSLCWYRERRHICRDPRVSVHDSPKILNELWNGTVTALPFYAI